MYIRITCRSCWTPFRFKIPIKPRHFLKPLPLLVSTAYRFPFPLAIHSSKPIHIRTLFQLRATEIQISLLTLGCYAITQFSETAMRGRKSCPRPQANFGQFLFHVLKPQRFFSLPSALRALSILNLGGYNFVLYDEKKGKSA